MRVLLLLTLVLAGLPAAHDLDQVRATLDARIERLRDGNWAEAPLAYLVITDVVADSAAERIGLQLGDRLARVAGQPVFWLRDAQPSGQVREFRWWRDGEWKQVQVDPGRVGFNYRPELDLALWCRRDLGIDDQHVLRAALCWNDHPQLARAELLAAGEDLQQGSGVRLLRALLAIQGDPRAAALQLLALGPDLPSDLQRSIGMYLGMAALVCGDSTLSAQARAWLESIQGLGGHRILHDLRRVGTGSHPEWPLAEQFTDHQRMRRELDTSDSTNASGRKLATEGAYADGARRGAYFNAVMTAWRRAYLSDSGHAISFDVRLTSTGSEASQWSSILWVRVCEAGGRNQLDLTLAEPDAEGISRYRLQVGSYGDGPLLALAADTQDDWHHVEIWQLRNAIEIAIDGKVVCRSILPLAPQGLQLLLHTQGTHSDIRNFTWYEALTRPVASSPEG